MDGSIEPKINKGLEYEYQIKQYLREIGIMPYHLFGICTQYGNDAAFVHKGESYFLEIKNKSAPDYGAKKIIYDPMNRVWKWNEEDDISQMFDAIGVLSQIPDFEPRKHVKADFELTQADKSYDLLKFRKIIELGAEGPNFIHEYYARKRCCYIQVEGKGFYHMIGDPAGLGVQQFQPEVVVRLRAKTHSSTPISNYSFRAILVGKMSSIFPSTYDIEGTFPPIQPNYS